MITDTERLARKWYVTAESLEAYFQQPQQQARIQEEERER